MKSLSVSDPLHGILTSIAKELGVTLVSLVEEALSEAVSKHKAKVVATRAEGFGHWDVSADVDERGTVLTLTTRPGWLGAAPDPSRIAKLYKLPLPTAEHPWLWTDLASPIRRTRLVPAKSNKQEVVIPDSETETESESESFPTP